MRFMEIPGTFVPFCCLLMLVWAAPNPRDTALQASKDAVLRFQSEKLTGKAPSSSPTLVEHPNHFSGFLSSLKEKILSKYHGMVNKLVNSKSIECSACKIGVGLVQTLVKQNVSTEEIASAATEFCIHTHIDSERVCKGICKEFAPEVVTVFAKLVLKPEEVCGIVLGSSCGTPYFPWEDWNITLPDIPQPPPVYPQPPKAGSPTYRFLQLTDVHYDSQYLAGSNANCGDPLCCRASSGKPAKASDAAWKFGDYRNCDTPLSTLENLFSHLADTQDTFDYVVWTGDVPAHNVWNQSREAQVRTLKEVTGLFRKYLPHKVVYPSLGNHEASPVNSFPPPFIQGAQSIDWLYNALAEAWSAWLPTQALDTVRKGGYYTVSPRPGFRIVSLNMNYCNNMNWWLLINMTDPAGELAWLVDTLQAAETAGEKVHILGHIPPGINDCLKDWSWNYYTVVSRYQNTIAGQFFGHTHTDSVTLFYDVETLKVPVSVAYVAPSVTPYTGLNMAYRLYTVDGHYNSSSYQVLDHATHYTDLEAAHTSGQLTWQLEYTAKAAYGLTSVYPRDWDRLVQAMKSNSTLLDTYNRFYTKSRNSGKCDQACRKARICEALTGRSHDPSFCQDLLSGGAEEHHRVMGSLPKHC